MKIDSLTLTISRGRWCHSHTVNLDQLDNSRVDLLDEIIQELRHHLDRSWRQLPPALQKSLLRGTFVPQPKPPNFS